MVSDFLCGARRRRIATQNENATQAEESAVSEWDQSTWLHNTGHHHNSFQLITTTTTTTTFNHPPQPQQRNATMSERADKSINDCGDDHEEQHDAREQSQEQPKPVPQYYTTRRQSPNGGRKLPKRKTPLGQLPDSLDEVNLTTTDHGEDVARSLGGIAALPAVHQFGQIGLDGPNSNSARMAGVGGGGGVRMKAPGSTRPSSSSMPPKLSLMQVDPSQLPSSSTSATFSVGHWNLRDSDVKTLPEFHPLDRSAVFVPNCPDASEVARRISDVLRARSVSAEYDNSKAKAKCVTSENVEFRVRLYRGKRSYAHGVIVEVQRRYGFSPTYAGDVGSILDAAEGKNLPVSARHHRSSAGLPPPPPLPSLVPDEAEEDGDSSSRSPGLESIQIASAMLSDAGVDRQSMGLEGLAALTDSYRIGKTTAIRASAEIVTGATPQAARCRDAILALVLTEVEQPKKSTSTNKADSGNDSLSGVEADADAANTALLRTLALTVLSNVLSNLTGTPELVSLRPVLSQAVLPALLSELKTATTNPRGADLAVRSLLPIVETFDRDYVECELLGHGAYELLIEAQNVGEARYDSLREQSSSCLRIIDESR